MPETKASLVRWDALTYDGSAPGRHIPSLHIYLKPIERSGETPDAARRLFQDFISRFYSGPPFLSPLEKLSDTIAYALEEARRSGGDSSLDRVRIAVAILDRVAGELHLFRHGDVRLLFPNDEAMTGGGFETIPIGTVEGVAVLDGSVPPDAVKKLSDLGGRGRVIVDGKTSGIWIRLGEKGESAVAARPETEEQARALIALPERPSTTSSTRIPLLPLGIVLLIFLVAIFWHEPERIVLRNTPAPAALVDPDRPSDAAPVPLVEGAPGESGSESKPPGTLVWDFQAGAAITSSPCLHGDLIVFGSRDGHIYALNQEDGTLVWSAPGPGGVGSSPATADGKVFFGEYGGTVVAVDLLSGEELWRIRTEGKIVSSPYYDSGVVYVGSFDKHLYALSASTGAQLWRFATGDAVWSSPRVSHGLVFVGSLDRNLYAVRIEDGTEAWRLSTGGPLYSSPTIEEEDLFVGSRDGKIYRVTVSTGEKRWETPVGRSVHSSAAVSEDRLVFGCEDGTIYCLSRETGEVLWSFPTGDRVPSSPAVRDGIAYVGSYDRFFYALDMEVGYPLWRVEVGGSVYSSPRLSGSRLFVGTNHGRLVALALSSDSP